VILRKAFVISTTFGEKAFSDDILLESFKQYPFLSEALGSPEDAWDSDDKDDGSSSTVSRSN